jgi:RES domain-containing protein
VRFQGVVYRAHDPRWAFSPLSGEGAARTGGRFNRPGRAALYTALSMPGMIKEAQQGFARKLDPLTIVSYDVDCEDVVDLTDHAELHRVRVEAAELAQAWRPLPGARRTVPTWIVADRLVKEGYAAAIVPSYAPGATTEDRNLVFWRWGPEPPHRITVYDPHGRLPKDQRSWNETSPY